MKSPSYRKMQSVTLSPIAISAAKCHRRSNVNWSRAVESLRSLWRSLDRRWISNATCDRHGGDGMIQPERGLAAYRAANTIGRIKLTHDDRHGMVHKVADAQTLAQYVPSLTQDVRNAKGHYPGTWRDSPSIHPAGRRVFERLTMIYRSAREHLSEREREREREREIYRVWNAPSVSGRKTVLISGILYLKVKRVCHPWIVERGPRNFFSAFPSSARKV